MSAPWLTTKWWFSQIQAGLIRVEVRVPAYGYPRVPPLYWIFLESAKQLNIFSFSHCSRVLLESTVGGWQNLTFYATVCNEFQILKNPKFELKNGSKFRKKIESGKHVFGSIHLRIMVENMFCGLFRVFKRSFRSFQVEKYRISVFD